MRTKIDINRYLQTEDLITRHLVEQLIILREQNNRLKEQIGKTGAWLHLKDINSWRGYDFYHYFCTKHQEVYGREYRLSGSLVRAYDRIEKFVLEHEIDKAQYKEFIDLAYSHYFNQVVVPHLGNLCSKSLFNRLCSKARKQASADDLWVLDQAIANESKQFSDEIAD